MARWRVIVTAPAEADAREALRWTRREFGTTQAKRYREAIAAAVRALRTGPSPTGSSPLHPSRPALRKLHLGARARHFLVYREAPGQVLLVLRILHDSVDLARHLPPAEAP